MMRHVIAILVTLFVMQTMVLTYADGVSFEHKDWQLVCDNTRTCRAAGYSPEDAKSRVTVLLTRKAGIGQDILARVKFADPVDEGDIDLPESSTLVIDKKSYGKIGDAPSQDINDDASSILLNKQQTQALLQALKGTSKIAFVSGNQEWILPTNGASAVLLKMDDVQGRVGTVSALIKKGDKSENSVLSALPMPIVHQKPLLDKNVKAWQSKVNWKILEKDLVKALKNDENNYCEYLTENSDREKEFTPHVEAVLSHNRLLVSALCTRAAYNVTYGFWIIHQQQPYQPALITTYADEGLNENRIESRMKDRGIGDCWSRSSWIWNGDDFVKIEDTSSGMCRMIMAGGAWNLPTYIAKVQ